MRKFLLLLSLCFLLITITAIAQELPDLTQAIDVEEYGFQFSVPEGWLVKMSDDEIAADEIAADYTVTLVTLGSGVTNAGEYLFQSGCEAVDVREDSINLRTAGTVIAICATEVPQRIYSFWEQNEQMMILSLTAESEVTTEVAQIWDEIIASVRPIRTDDLALVDEPYASEGFHITIPYPENWSIASPRDDLLASLAFYELESDIDSEDLPEGILIDIGQISIESLNGEASIVAVIDPLQASVLDWDAARNEGNFTIVAESGIGLTVSDEDGAYHYYIVTVNQGTQLITVWHLRAADEETLVAYTPMFLTMLASAESTLVDTAIQVRLDAEDESSGSRVNPAELDLMGTVEEICEQATPAIEPETRSYDRAEQVLEDAVDYQAIICTDAGAIHLELFEEETPITVNNFAFLATNNYYNNTIFHRVLADFMAQAGDPTGTGRGGPGYQFQDEFLPDLTFDRPYLLAMANAGAGTNGSQFFITFVPTPHLDNLHTIFGEVISGQDVVDSIILRDPLNPTAPATILQTIVIVTSDMVVEQ